MVIFIKNSSNLILSLDIDYNITTTTGNQSIDVPVSLKVRGENGIVGIPLAKTKSDEKPFQSNSTNEFACRTTDVGKIRCITIEHHGTDRDIIWHLKSVQIKKGNETFK